ncbi:MAG: ECF-type sigma factor, partial [Planctomycetaceae bacterium]
MTDPAPDSPVAPGEVTQLLAAIESGHVSADQLLPLVYRELKRLAAARMANERVDHTL